MKLVIATTNDGKFKEIKAFLEREIGENVDLLSLGDFPTIPKVEETAKTVKGNALIKAKAYSRALGIAVLAEDSALEVEALGGAPGIYSSRYGKDDRDRINRLLTELKGVPFEKRRARFRCVMVLALPSGETYTSAGKVEGYITDLPRGEMGFGYDPVFLYPPWGKTFAEVSGEEKLAVSHRGEALRGIIKFVKLAYLEELLRSFGRVAVALSGGVDSSFLAFCAKRVCKKVWAIFADTSLVTEEVRIRVKNVAELLGLELVTLKLDLLSISQVAQNDPKRCYYCKRAMYELFLNWAKDKDAVVLDGTNFSDLSEDRPGLVALEELRIVSPLKLAKLNKSEIRELSAFFKLPFSDQPSGTCLATRFHVGLPIDTDTLRKIERAEGFLKLLGFKVVRARVDQPGICRLELGKGEIRKALDQSIYEAILNELKSIGFNRVSIDLEGYRR